MTDIDLARRAVACRGWKWLPGVQAIDPTPNGLSPQRLGNQFVEPADGCGWLPDLDDPATLGCLLALAREAWGHVGIWVEYTSDSSDGIPHWEISWGAWPMAGPRLPAAPPPGGWYNSEAEALVATLEAAPVRP